MGFDLADELGAVEATVCGTASEVTGPDLPDELTTM
jgi:hypothetical protein